MNKLESIPRSINILGRKVKVHVGTIPNDLMGMCEGPKLLISIADNQTEDEAKSTLFHESLHMAIYLSGLSNIIVNEDIEEALVTMLENGFQHAVDVSKLEIKGRGKK
jgi:hypothetical protein